MTLYADIEYLKSTIDALYAQYPEIAEDETLRTDMLQGSTELDYVVSTILKQLRKDEITLAGIDTIIRDLEVRKARASSRRDAKRNLLAGLLERANTKKLTLPEATLSLAWRMPAPIMVDETVLADNFVKIEHVRKPDMAAIKASVEAGVMPLGVAMGNGQSVLTIRVK